MRLQHTHHLGGPGRVNIDAPELPVFITIDPEAEYRETDIMADRGLAAWAGPSGIGGVALGIKVDRPTILSSMKRTFLRQQGSYVSGGGSVIAGGDRSVASGGGRGGSVRATGRGAIACGGSIENVVTGDGARISGVERAPLPPVGVNITAPPLSTFLVRGARSVTVLTAGHDEIRIDEDDLRDIFAVGLVDGIPVVSR